MVAEEAIKATHQDRPTVKTQLPFRVVPGRYPTIEHDQDVPVQDGTTRRITMNVPIETSPYGNQIGLKILQTMEAYKILEASVDGYLAAIDDLTTQLIKSEGEVKRQASVIQELKSRKNGKKEE